MYSLQERKLPQIQLVLLVVLFIISRINLEALAAFKSFPEFKHHLSTVNEHRKLLLHFAVHL